MVGVLNSAKVTRPIALPSTRPPLNVRPIRLYPAHSWVPGSEIGAEGEGWKKMGRRWRGRKGCRSQGEQNNNNNNNNHPTCLLLCCSSAARLAPSRVVNYLWPYSNIYLFI